MPNANTPVALSELPESCPDCLGTSRGSDCRPCEGCDATGQMSCCYCGLMADAGSCDIGLSYGEFRCIECDDHIERGAARIAKLDQARADYEGACDTEGDRQRDERAA